MSVLVKGMEMPENCFYCELMAKTNDGYMKCPLAKFKYSGHDYYTYVAEQKAPHPCCPLVEVPTPHGRLIDADALTAAQQLSVIVVGERPYIDAKEVVQLIYGMPTIIEAEEGEG